MPSPKSFKSLRPPSGSNHPPPLRSVSDFPNRYEEGALVPLWGVLVPTGSESRGAGGGGGKAKRGRGRSRGKAKDLGARSGSRSTCYGSAAYDRVYNMHVQVAERRGGADVVDRRTEGEREAKWRKGRMLYESVCREEYRSGSVENALWGLSNKEIGREVFVQSIVSEFKFDRRLRMEEHLGVFYDSFDGSRYDAVDYRVILCTYLNLVMFKLIRDRCSHLFWIMYDIFTAPFTDQASREDALQLAGLCACTDEELRETRGKLDRALRDMAPERGLKENFRVVDKDMLMEV